MRIRKILKDVLPRKISRRLSRQMALNYLSGLNPEYDPGKKTILAINHLFDQDLRALALANTRYNLIVVDAGILFKGAQFFFSPEVIKIRAAYDSEPAINRDHYRKECRLFFDHLRSRFEPNLIILPNDNYYSVREFIHVARENGVPTVIMDKEGTISPHAFEAEAKRARDFTPCISDHVFVWSKRQRAYWRKRGVAAEKITIIGQLRSDLFFAVNDNQVDKYFDKIQPLVTFFSYSDNAYIPHEEFAVHGISWVKMKNESHEALWRLANQYPDRNFIIKCHPHQRDIDSLRRQYDSSNLRVIGGADIGNELIKRSELIIAFQTTAIIEGLFLKKRIIYTTWDANYARLKDDLLPFHRAACIVEAATQEDFARICGRLFSGDDSDFRFSPEQQATRAQFINEYLYKPDGHTCERFLTEVGRFLA